MRFEIERAYDAIEMWLVIRFMLGLLLALGFAAAVLAATVGTYTLAKEAVASGGDAALFEARVRHYTDSGEAAPDGTHPVIQFAASVAGAWVVAIGALVALRRLTRSLETASNRHA